MSPQQLRVVVAEDHYLFREGVIQLLERSGDIEVVAAVEDAGALLERVSQLEPDAVVTDIRMPPSHQTEGIDAARRIRVDHPATGVVVLSQYINAIYAFELFQDGTEGLAYLLKDRVGDVDDLRRAVFAVSEGGSVIDPAVVETMLARNGSSRSDRLADLTERELSVLQEMAQGKSNAAIAESLFVSASSVEKHISAILAKLGLDAGDTAVNRRVAAVLAFFRTWQPDGSG
ncbi:MAG: response regulator transcription factor [Nitriliruptorales bacterium]|nr:response regulator transcription factor [Nitriliruptorales bacterium]